MLIAFLLLNIFVILLTIAWRYPAIAIPFAVPFPVSPGIFPLLAVFTAAAVAVIVWELYWRVKQGRPVAPLLELLIVYPVLYLLIWTLMPFHGDAVLSRALIGVLFIIVIFLFFRDRKSIPSWGVTREHFPEAIKWLTWPTVSLSLFLIAIACVIGTRFRFLNTLISLVSYPLFSVVQLLFFLVFPIQRLKLLTDSKIKIVAVTAVLFALVHWPNTGLIAACGLGMAIWAAVYLKYPNIYAVALSMGILATVYIQILPANITQSVVVGPHYVFDRFRAMPCENVFKQAEQLLANTGSPEGRNDNDNVFIKSVYKVLLNRIPDTADLDLWAALTARCGRETTLKAFLRSDDFRSAWWFREGKWPRSCYTGLTGYIDRNGYRHTDDGIFLRGWAANTKTGRIPDDILIFVKGSLAHTGSANVPRKDVADYFNMPGIETSGFEMTVKYSGSLFLSPRPVRVFAVDEDSMPVELLYP